MYRQNQYCLYLVLSQIDEEYLFETIMKINRDDCPKTWNHFQTKGFHFQLTKWSPINFDILSVLKTGGSLGSKQPNAIVTTQNIPGWASISFQSFELDTFNEELEQKLQLPIVDNIKGVIGFSEEMPSENTINNAVQFIMNVDWYIVKMERTHLGIYTRVSKPVKWRFV